MHRGVMFERFDDRARRVIVLSQEEARGLQHNHIGTEHLLLGMLSEDESTAAQVLCQFGMSLVTTRQEVAERVAPGKKALKGHIPFTPRAKKVLELALRESLSLGHNAIGTEHLLLGTIREGEGVGAQVIAAHAGDLRKVRLAVISRAPSAGTVRRSQWLRSRAVVAQTGTEGAEALRATPAVDASLHEATRLAGPHPVGSHHLVLAALHDPESAAARALTTLGLDLDQARDALRAADVTGTSDEGPEDAGRRSMSIVVAEDLLTIQTTDSTLLGLARAALEAVAGQGDRSDTIRGDLAVSVSLGGVWHAIRDSLADIRLRATGDR